MTQKEFITEAVNELLDDGFSVFLHNKTKVQECGGWFSYTDKEITVAMNNAMGFEIFIHEYSHFLQWKHHTEWFLTKNGGTQVLFDWLDTTLYSDDILDLAMRDAIDLELDCERQSIWLIETNDLPVDVDKYKRAANAYLLFYQFVRSKRMWSKTSPYNNERILASMPTELQPLEFYTNPSSISDEVRAYFEECFIE